jgi:GNAT superfamily N-acetyltransferase
MPTPWTVRPALPQDSAAIREVLRASYTAGFADAYRPELLAVALPRMTEPNPNLIASGRYYVAASPQTGIVGCGGWSLERPGTGAVEPGLAHVRHFATAPAMAGCGVGRALFEHSLAEAARIGAADFECYASLNAEAFYAALGFVAERRLEVALGPDLHFPAVLMRRRGRPG